MEADCVANGLHDNTDQTFIKSMKVDGGASQNDLLMQVSECSAVCVFCYVSNNVLFFFHCTVPVRLT